MTLPTKGCEDTAYSRLHATLPDRIHTPTLSLKRSRHPSVSSTVALPLPEPEVRVGPRNVPVTAGVTVPEAAVNEYD